MKYFFKINWLQTLRVNFKTLPFHFAKKLPIIVFGSFRFYGHGKISIEGPVKRGMIRFGSNFEDFFYPKNKSVLFIDGMLTFKGRFTSGKGISIRVNKEASLSVGAHSFIGSSCMIFCSRKIHIGNYCKMGFETNVYDTNFHFMMNLSDGIVTRKDLLPVTIGDYCWIGNRCSLAQGTVTPECCIIASGTLCNKDYTETSAVGSLIGGVPAKLIRTGVTMVFDELKELKLEEYFSKNPDHSFVKLEDLK